MGRLVLSSGGYLDGQRGERCDEVIERASRGKRVLLVSNATLTGSNTKGVPILLENFSKIAKSVTEVALDETNISKLKNFDTIYITGGDLTPFLELISRCDLADAFRAFLENGGTIIGESAGSMIFGKDLKWTYDIKKGTKPKYDVILPSYSGLGFVDINIFPHWNKASEEMKAKVSAYENEHNIKITKMCDGDFVEYSFEKQKAKE